MPSVPIGPQGQTYDFRQVAHFDNAGLQMKPDTRVARRWPIGYRLLVWLLGSLAAIVLIVGALFVIGAI